MNNKIAIKVTSPEHGAKVVGYLKGLGGKNRYNWGCGYLGEYYYIDKKGEMDITSVIPEGYTEAFLPEDTLPEPSNFRAKAALMCLSFYEVEDGDRFVKAVRDADELIKELNK